MLDDLLGPEEGHFALAMGCVLAICQAVLPFIGLRFKREILVRMAIPLAFSQAIALLLAFLSLILAAIRDDFSVLNIAENSSLQKPLLYKITGVWGNHEGSLLLWIVILGLCGVAIAWPPSPYALKQKKPCLPLALRARVLAVLGAISAGFQLFCLLTSNPFIRLFPMPANGQGMNPLLQDPGLAFHPPILYSGYVGFAVPFAFAVAALIEGRVDAQWGRWVRPWTVTAWALLTCGIALGSWWSYYVLGWGGYWFWDPVENASLIPWLSGTALLHCAIVVEKRDGLKIWTILLAIASFSFSLSGTFLVRSGILNSVHAFANDPLRGIFILSLLALITGGAFLLFAWRAPILKNNAFFSPISREAALILNNILLCALCAVVVTGTLYPPFIQLLFHHTISVGKPFFDSVTIPLTIPLLFMMGLGSVLSWKRAKISHFKNRFFIGGLLASLGFALSLLKLSSLLAAFCASGALWIIGISITDFIIRARAIGSWQNIPRSFCGAVLAHIGVAISVLGICGMSAAEHHIIEARIGENFHLSGLDWRLISVTSHHGPNYEALEAAIEISSHGTHITTLYPEERNFTQQHQITSFVSLHTSFWGDLYAVLGQENHHGLYVLRLHKNPLASWIWVGGFIMALGGIISLSDRRLRIGAPTKNAYAKEHMQNNI